MSNSAINVDPRIIPIVRSLKEHTTLNPSQNIATNKIIQDLSSSENTAKMKFKEKLKENNKIENEKNKTDDIKKSNKPKNGITRFPNKSNTVVRKKSSTKISIDGSVDNKMKSGTADNHQSNGNNINNSNGNKIRIVSKQKEPKINPTSTFHLSTGQTKQKQNNYNNMKTKSKYFQNLMSDMSIKKYKQNCIDLIKNDNLVKKLYEQAGFEKTNYSYEYFITTNFFNRPLFMYKLEMLFLDESNFIKKNFKENFFKSEIVKYLNEFTSEEIYKRQMNNLKDVFQDGFKSITNFDLFHDQYNLNIFNINNFIYSFIILLNVNKMNIIIIITLNEEPNGIVLYFFEGDIKHY